MPTYQYVCTECGEDIEVLQKFSDAPLTAHDVCGGKLRKVFSPVGIVFKGSGFYRTDSRGGSSVSSSSNGSNGSNGSAEKTSASEGDKSDKSDKSANGSSSGDSKKSDTTSSSSTSSSESKVA